MSTKFKDIKVGDFLIQNYIGEIRKGKVESIIDDCITFGREIDDKGSRAYLLFPEQTASTIICNITTHPELFL